MCKQAPKKTARPAHHKATGHSASAKPAKRATGSHHVTRPHRATSTTCVRTKSGRG